MPYVPFAPTIQAKQPAHGYPFRRRAAKDLAWLQTELSVSDSRSGEQHNECRIKAQGLQ